MENIGQIVRSKKTGKSRYTPINNDILQSSQLTCEEKTILIYLLSLPENWVVYKTVIWQKMNIGRNRFNAHWKGLVEKGYIVSVRVIDAETNLVRGWNHIVYEEPVIDESWIDQPSDLPKFGQSENPTIYKEEIQQSNNSTKETVNQQSLFEEFWNMYTKRGNKKTAYTTFKNLKKSEIEFIQQHIPIYVKNHIDNDKMDYLPHFTTYLNGKRWNDELPYTTKKPIEVTSNKPKIATL